MHIFSHNFELALRYQTTLCLLSQSKNGHVSRVVSQITVLWSALNPLGQPKKKKQVLCVSRSKAIQISIKGTNIAFLFFRFHSHPKAAKAIKAYSPPSYHSLPVFCLVLSGFSSRKRSSFKAHSKWTLIIAISRTLSTKHKAANCPPHKV